MPRTTAKEADHVGGVNEELQGYTLQRQIYALQRWQMPDPTEAITLTSTAREACISIAVLAACETGRRILDEI